MKVTDFIANFLHAQGVDTVFELSGGMITHILDSLYNQNKIRIVTMHHEQGASFAADGYAREKNLPGVALATSGPGATNLLTGIGNCYFDSVPAVFITGQVNTHEQKGKREIRQLGFQETDIVSMAKPVTKAAYAISHESEIERIFYEAFSTAISGRPGPVLIDIPMNIQRAEITVGEIKKAEKSFVKTDLKESIGDLETAIRNSKNPLILAGRGVRASKSVNALITFAERTHIPVITSLLATDTLPADHPLRVGFIGAYGNRWANLCMEQNDLLIVIGSRLDIRQTGADVGFFGKRKIFHIDCEKAEINNRVLGCNAIVSDVAQFLEQANLHLSDQPFSVNKDWMATINELKVQWPDNKESVTDGINPNSFMHILSLSSKSAGAFVADVGNHQMWAAQSLKLITGQGFHTSGGMGAMGYALPAAIGITLANNKPVVVICGDGGVQLNIQELQTIFRNNLPVKIVIINNKSLGMIRQFQDSYFEGRYQSTYWGYSAPDFVKIATAYGIPAARIVNASDIDMGVKGLWDNNGPALLEVMIDVTMNAYPKIAFGKPITEMEPFSKPIEMEGT